MSAVSNEHPKRRDNKEKVGRGCAERWPIEQQERNFADCGAENLESVKGVSFVMYTYIYHGAANYKKGIPSAGRNS